MVVYYEGGGYFPISTHSLFHDRHFLPFISDEETFLERFSSTSEAFASEVLDSFQSNTSLLSGVKGLSFRHIYLTFTLCK